MLAAHRQLCREYPDALLILAPRHPARGDALRAMIEAAGLSVAQRSRSADFTAGA